MGLFKSGSAPSYRKRPVLEYQMHLNDWCSDAVQMSTKKVQKIELCWAPTPGKDHHKKKTHNDDDPGHTFFCAYIEPTTSSYRTQEVVLFERFKYFHGTPYHHSVLRLKKLHSGFPRPTYVDYASVIPQNPPRDVIHELEVERSLELDNHLTLQELATILKLIGNITNSVWPGVSSENAGRLFAFTCWAALVPPGKSPTGQFVHEDEARHFLDQLSWRTRDMDEQSLDAVKLIQQKRAEQSDR